MVGQGTGAGPSGGRASGALRPPGAAHRNSRIGPVVGRQRAARLVIRPQPDNVPGSSQRRACPIGHPGGRAQLNRFRRKGPPRRRARDPDACRRAQ
ncbi:hypothetical protein G6F31_018162 [Rhizopus arrhizus]|nr:hypothetical protein G6F31_018162 [Rhizopus arrhizus]